MLGYKAQVVDNEDGIVVDYDVQEGNPPDAPQLAPAIGRISERVGHAPGAVTADRGYGEARVEADLARPGRENRCHTLQKANPAKPAAQSSDGNGSATWSNGEPVATGRISHLKHRYGWARTGLTGREGTAIWCGHGVLAHNLVKITTLAA